MTPEELEIVNRAIQHLDLSMDATGFKAKLQQAVGLAEGEDFSDALETLIDAGDNRGRIGEAVARAEQNRRVEDGTLKLVLMRLSELSDEAVAKILEETQLIR